MFPGRNRPKARYGGPRPSGRYWHPELGIVWGLPRVAGSANSSDAGHEKADAEEPDERQHCLKEVDIWDEVGADDTEQKEADAGKDQRSVPHSVTRCHDALRERLDAGRLRDSYDVEPAVAVRVPDVVRLLVVRRCRHRERAGL